MATEAGGVQEYNRAIIADEPRGGTSRRLFWGVLLGCLAVGTAAAMLVAQQGLTLSHYDARAHLVVARRVTDSLTPGWRQLGAVWLPLPHVLNFLPLQWDWNFRTGYASTGLSILAVSLGLATLSGLLLRLTGSAVSAVTAPVLILLNPNVLYLQSTPMTEPLLFGCAFLAVAAVEAWTRRPGPNATALACAAVAALALCRYEGWAIAGALVGWAVVKQRLAALPLAAALLAAVVAFLFLSWGATGQWFVSSGFFVPDNPAQHNPVAVVRDVVRATRGLGGDILVAAASAGVAVGLWSVRQTGPVSGASVLLTLLAAAALPMAAFYQGHPFRIRYMVPLVVAGGALSALAVARVPARVRPWAALVLCALVVQSRPPWDRQAAMVTEAQWETPYRRERQAISRYLDGQYDGTPILASMGSLAHYMQEASAHGLSLANFLHEGNGDLWTEALRSPRRHVRWVAIEQRAEGGDMLATRLREDASFLEGFERVAEGGGVALFKRLD